MVLSSLSSAYFFSLFSFFFVVEKDKGKSEFFLTTAKMRCLGPHKKRRPLSTYSFEFCGPFECRSRKPQMARDQELLRSEGRFFKVVSCAVQGFFSSFPVTKELCGKSMSERKFYFVCRCFLAPTNKAKDGGRQRDQTINRKRKYSQ